MKVGAKGMKRNAGKPELLAGESMLAVTVKGPEEETPELWADLVEFVLDALARERRKRNGGENHAA